MHFLLFYALDVSALVQINSPAKLPEYMFLKASSNESEQLLKKNDETGITNIIKSNNHLRLRHELQKWPQLINGIARHGLRPLQQATIQGSIQLVEILIDHGADVTVTKADGSSLLHLGALTSNIDLIRLLLKSGCSPAVENERGETPLFSAVNINDLKIARELLRSGANVLHRDSHNFNVFHLCALGGKTPELISLLCEAAEDQRGLDESICSNIYGASPLETSIFLDSVQAFNVMLSYVTTEGLNSHCCDLFNQALNRKASLEIFKSLVNFGYDFRHDLGELILYGNEDADEQSPLYMYLRQLKAAPLPLFVAVGAKSENVARMTDLSVCEVEVSWRSVSNDNTQLRKELRTCSYCSGVANRRDDVEQVPLVVKAREQQCSYDLQLYSGKCVVVEHFDNDSSKHSGTGGTDNGSCQMQRIENEAKAYWVDGVVFPVNNSDIKFGKKGLDVKVPTFFLQQLIYSKILNEASFRNGSMFISAKVLPDLTWMSRSLGFCFLASLAVINVVLAVFLQKLDLELELNQVCRRPPKVDTPNSDDKRRYDLLNEERSSSNYDEEDSNETKADNPNYVSRETTVAFDTDVQTADPGRVQVKQRSKCDPITEDRPSKFSAICTIVVAVITTSCLLVLIFFFHNIFWYVMVVMYSLWACMAFSYFGCKLFNRFFYGMNLHFHQCWIFLAKFAPGFLLGAGLITIWLLFMDRKWIWILWDLLSSCICLFLLVHSRFHSFKWLSIMAALFLVYDAFAVYVTPLFTESGKSVMEEAVIGSHDSSDDSSFNKASDWLSIMAALFLVYDAFAVYVTPLFTESGKSVMEEAVIGSHDSSDDSSFNKASDFLPILFLTKIEIGTDSPCIETAYNILGMGDVIIPGFLIVHASIFGIIRSYSSTYSYAILSVLAYTLGYCLVFVSLMVMDSAQPVLVFVIPLLLLVNFSVAALRKEFKVFMDIRDKKPHATNGVKSTVVDTPRNDRSFRIEAHASENGMNDHARGDQASEIAGSEKEMTDSLRQRQDYNDAP